MPVYQYEGKHYDLPDGLSDDQAIGKIKSHLGQNPKSGGGGNFLDQVMQQTGEFMGEAGKTLGSLVTGGRTPPSGASEALTTVGTGAIAQGAGLVPAAMQSINNMTQGHPANFEQNYGSAIDRMTYSPKTELGQEAAHGIGEFINRNLIPIAPMHLGGLGGAVSRASVPRQRIQPKVADVAGAAGDILQPKNAGRVDIDLTQGADTAGKSLYADQRGVITPELPDQGMQLGKQRTPPVDSPALVFDEMQRQLTAGDRSAVDTSLPRGDAIGDMVSDIRARESQRAVDERQMALEFETKKQQGLDFNAAERARQESATVPGMREISPGGRQTGAINPDVFVEGFQKLKKLIDGTWLRASSDGAVLSVEAIKDSHNLGRVDFIKPAGEAKTANLKADWTGVKPEAQGQGIASEMYKFASELGNDIKPSDVQSEGGKALWSSLEKKGIASEGEIKFRKSSPGGKQSGYILLPGKKAKALTNLASKAGISKSLGELAPSQWHPELAVEMAKGAKDVDQNFLQKGLNLLTKGGLYQSLKTHNPMVRYVTEKILDADRKARADVRDWVHGTLGPAIRNLKKSELGDIWAIMELADFNQKAIDLEALAKRGFSERQLEVVQAHRQAMDYAYEMINKARAAAGKEPIDKRVAYAAMRASGDFRRLVYDAPGGKVVGIIGSDLRARTNKLKTELEAKGYHIGEERYFGGMPRERGSANQAFMSAVEFLAENDPKAKEFVDVLNQIRTTEVYNFLNAKTHTMEKKGIVGMQGRGRELGKTLEQDAREGFKAQLNYLEAAIKWGHLSEASSAIKPLLDSPDVKMPNAKVWSEKYLYNALGFNPSVVGRSIETAVSDIFRQAGVGYSIGRDTMAVSRKITNSLLLALNPRFWVTNLVQPLQAMPGVKAMMIARGLDAGFDFGTGWSYLVEGASTAMKKDGRMGKLSEFERQATEYAYKNHVYGTDLIEHSNRVRKDVAYYADQIGNSVAGSIENATRQTVFYGLAHMLKENGMSVKNGLFETAQNLTDITMNNYSSVERPQIYNSAGPLGDLAVNLQSYKHNELSRLALIARHAQEHKSLRPVAAQLGSSLAFGGILGTVAFAEADQLYKFITKQMGKPDSLSNLVIKLSENTNKKVYDATGGKVDEPYLLSHGVFSMAGLDMTKSLGLTDVVPNNPIDLVFPGGSKLGEAAGAAYDMAKSPTEMNAKRLARAASPVATQGIIDNQWFTKDTPQGKLSVNADNLRGQAYRNDTDVMAKNFAFTGINESVQKQKTYNIEKIARDYVELRQRPLKEMRDQLFSKGQIEEATVLKYLKLRGNPSTLETDLRQYAKEQNMSAKELNLMKAAASSAVGSISKAQDYLEMFQENK